MSQSLRRLWQALHTLVGGGRHWLTTPLTTPSTSGRTGHTGGGRRSGDESVTIPDQSGLNRASLEPARAPTPDGDHDGPERARSESDGPERVGAGDESTASDQSPEQQILAALADNGGRMKQSALHEVTEMSQSSVSRRLIGLEDRGEVTRYEIGRGKVVFLPDEEPGAFASPLEGADRPVRTAP